MSLRLSISFSSPSSASLFLSATGTARSLFDNGVGRKLEGYHRWSNALTNYLTGRGLHGRDKQFMHRYSTADGPSVRRMRPLSSLRLTLSHLIISKCQREYRRSFLSLTTLCHCPLIAQQFIACYLYGIIFCLDSKHRDCTTIIIARWQR